MARRRSLEPLIETEHDIDRALLLQRKEQLLYAQRQSRMRRLAGLIILLAFAAAYVEWVLTDGESYLIFTGLVAAGLVTLFFDALRDMLNR